MAVNKNFVVKNGLEVNTRLILANATTNKVGIGSTGPRFELDVAGGIGATDMYVVGVSTVLETFNVGSGGKVLSVIAGAAGLGTSKVGIGTSNPTFLLDVRSPVSTGQTAFYVQGDVRITGDLAVDDLTLDDVTVQDLAVQESLIVGSNGGAGIATIKQLNVSGLTTTNQLIAHGISTFRDYVQFIDNASLYFGNGSDLNIYHDGSNSYIQEQGQGNLYVQSNGGSVNIRTNTSENAFVANQDGSVELYYDNAKKFETLSIGATVTGTLFANQLGVSGVSTLGTVQVSSGIITATSGIVTYYGDGSYLTGNARNLTATIGIGTSGAVAGYGVSFIQFVGPGVSTITYDNTTGIATVTISGGGSGSASIGIGTTPGEAFTGIITAGNLWYNSSLGRMFIYYQDVNSAQWVDASPFNVGVITSLTNVSFAPGSASNPSLYFLGDSSTGFFSPGSGQFTVVSSGSSILNVNANGINVTGIITSTSVSTGNINSSGIVTATDFDALSDIRYKENINTVDSALSKVDQLRGVKFDWKESGLPSYGVIAQELEEVLPELVHGSDPKTVNYNGIIGVLIEAIKELKAEVEELKKDK